ncbi:hypothetical protein D8674_020774 [Pyrus ussuriensis x Pyrus communis]|uniref:Uncharacterized protein n=1 Tax=Pyrus ussuriensis x Pyrus communis TaxID=2448454 RepID=A0A5N5HGM4_9ROSA|nr:hypothetical protein D8674_020774 [Pyrus ussuriensis x Pyrus communis]
MSWTNIEIGFHLSLSLKYITDEGANVHDSNGSDDDSENIDHGTANAGGSIGFEENRNNGRSRSPYTLSNRHHNSHYGAANSKKKCIGPPTLFASTWTSLVHLCIAFQY